jgi:hypothetical protein
MIGILYNAIMHNLEFGQAYCKDLLKRIQNLFHIFLSFISFSMHFRILNKFLLEKENRKKTGIPRNNPWAAFGPRSQPAGLAQQPRQPGWPTWCGARALGGHHAQHKPELRRREKQGERRSAFMVCQQ